MSVACGRKDELRSWVAMDQAEVLIANLSSNRG